MEFLLKLGCDLFIENEAKETACDCAEREGHTEIAGLLEAEMLFFEPKDADCFSSDLDAATADLLDAQAFITTPEGFVGLREQDLREAKDLLLVETSDMLRVPLFTAEALLRKYGKSIYYVVK